MCHWQKAALLVATETKDWDDILVMDQLVFYSNAKNKIHKGMSFRIANGKCQMFERIRIENPQKI